MELSVTMHKVLSQASLIIILVLFSCQVKSLQMTCNYKNNDTIIVSPNNSFEIKCKSDQSFKFCILEKSIPKSSEKERKYCKFHFHKPFQFPGTPSVPRKWEVFYTECNLDPESTRIQILEKTVQKQCHLRISNFSHSGKFCFLLSVSSNIIFEKYEDKP